MHIGRMPKLMLPQETISIIIKEKLFRAVNAIVSKAEQKTTDIFDIEIL